MSITSGIFLLFILVITVIYFNINIKFRWIILLISNLIFYCLSCGEYTIILIICAIFAYIMGILIKRNNNRTTYVISILLPIGTLVAYKYLGFFREIIMTLAGFLNISIMLPQFRIIAPLGISFFILQIVSYLTDVYKGKIKEEKHLGKYLTYITFFATIVSGPIERYSDFKKEIDSDKRFNYEIAVNGLFMMLFGMFKKVIVSERIGEYVGLIYNNVYSHVGFELILASVLYAFQLYADFSGYIDITRGASKILGINLMENFNFPYISKSVQEFWGKWHISLSSWLKDYVYIPLGGNRVSTFRKYFNIVVTFFVSGLWHGANITFVVWGLLHAFYQIVERIISNFKKDIFKSNKKGLIKIIINFILVDFAWIFFRATNIEEAWYIVTHLFVFNEIKISLGTSKIMFIVMGLIIFAMVEYVLYNYKNKGKYSEIMNSSKVKWISMFILIMILLMLRPITSSEFIYGMF